MSPVDRVVVVVGPTASGKSDLAVALARRLGDAEIVNADSMQFYRGMDVGTAKASHDEKPQDQPGSSAPPPAPSVTDAPETPPAPPQNPQAPPSSQQ